MYAAALLLLLLSHPHTYTLSRDAGLDTRARTPSLHARLLKPTHKNIDLPNRADPLSPYRRDIIENLAAKEVRSRTHSDGRGMAAAVGGGSGGDSEFSDDGQRMAGECGERGAKSAVRISLAPSRKLELARVLSYANRRGRVTVGQLSNFPCLTFLFWLLPDTAAICLVCLLVCLFAGRLRRPSRASTLNTSSATSTPRSVAY